jgi:hypothetical protein
MLSRPRNARRRAHRLPGRESMPPPPTPLENSQPLPSAARGSVFAASAGPCPGGELAGCDTIGWIDGRPNGKRGQAWADTFPDQCSWRWRAWGPARVVRPVVIGTRRQPVRPPLRRPRFSRGHCGPVPRPRRPRCPPGHPRWACRRRRPIRCRSRPPTCATTARPRSRPGALRRTPAPA